MTKQVRQAITPTHIIGSTGTAESDTLGYRTLANIKGDLGLGTNLTNTTVTGTLAVTGGQIAFPATAVPSANANTLDDYEEGTFTPTVVGSTSDGTGTYTTQVGRYTKIGNRVYIDANVVWTAHTGTGDLRFGGLPFLSKNITNYFASGAFGFASNIDLSANNVATVCVPPNAAYVIALQYPVGGGLSGAVPIDTAGSVIYSVSYE